MDTKKLRQKILDLAIRGKLVPQDPNDEPASVLLERIRAEKERLIKEGKIKRSKKTTSDTPHYKNEAPFEVPESWEWTTIGEIASSILYGVSESAKEKGRYKLLRITDIQNNKVNWETVPFTDYDNNKAQAYLLNDGDILFARTGATVGKSYLVEGLKDSAIYASYLIRVQTSSVILPSYIKFFLESGFYWEQISLNSVGIGQPNVNGTTLAALTIPIPPYREQLRIVEETKKWLAVIDGLDVEIDILQTYITQAKSKILDLAIHGKLVPQDPNDEPAIEFLKRKNSKFTPCDNAHDTNQLPNSWCWTTLGDVCELVTGSTPSKLHPEYYGGDFPFYKPTDLDAGRHVNIPSEFLTDEGKNVSRIIPVGSTAICCIGSIGKCGYIEKEGTTNQQINTAVPSKSLSPLYLYYFCNSSYFIDELSADSSAITISIVNKSKLSKMLISLPPYNEQLRIVAKIEELFAVLDEIQKSIEA